MSHSPLCFPSSVCCFQYVKVQEFYPLIGPEQVQEAYLLYKALELIAIYIIHGLETRK